VKGEGRGGGLWRGDRERIKDDLTPPLHLVVLLLSVLLFVIRVIYDGGVEYWVDHSMGSNKSHSGMQSMMTGVSE